MISWTKNSQSLTIFLNGAVHTVPADSPKYSMCLDAIKADDEHALQLALEFKQEFTLSQEKKVSVTPQGVFLNGKELHNEVARRIFEFRTQGLPYEPLVKFLDNLYANPTFALAENSELQQLFNLNTYDADAYVSEFVNYLFTFLEKHGHPITEDGCFLAYKNVRDNFLDIHSGKIDNTPGVPIPRLERSQCDPNKDLECSNGYHVGNLSYAGPNGHFQWQSGTKYLIVKVNPADVIRVPREDSTKMRVCWYEVIQEYKPLDRPLYTNDLSPVGTEAKEEVEYGFLEEIEPAFICVEDLIRFEYRGKIRHVRVEQVDDEYVLGILLAPEEHAGETRRFATEHMENVELIEE